MDLNLDFITRSPMFETLRIHGGAVFHTGRPGPDDFQRLLDTRDPPVLVSNGVPLRIVRQGPKPVAFEDKYEARTFLRGELQVRQDHWHDYFNVLVWLAFPRSKATLNARHFTALQEQHAAGALNRGPVQDALTLFDEGGVVVASSDNDLLDLLQEWRWKELFWANRERLRARARFALFGHALYEKALEPFVGITGRGILLRMESRWLAEPPPERLAELDARLAVHLADTGRLRATRELAVVPILGVPGWSADNERESYYDNLDYFRPGRLKEMRES